MIGSFILMLMLVILTGVVLVTFGAAIISFIPALVLFVGELWMFLFSAALRVAAVALLFCFVFFCAAVAGIW